VWELINRCSPRLGHSLAKPTHTVLRTYYTMLVFWVLLEFSSNGSDPRPGVLSCPLRANTLLIAVCYLDEVACRYDTDSMWFRWWVLFSSNCARDSHAIILRWIRSVKKFRYHCLKKFRYPQAFRLSLKSKFVLHHWFLAISVLACRQLPVHLYSLIYCRHPTNFIHIGTECIRLVYSKQNSKFF